MTLTESQLAELELKRAESDIAYVDAVRKQAVGAVDRQRANAERAWTIAGALGAVVLAAGFTDTIQDAVGITQVVGIISLALWFAAALLFMRVSLAPRRGNTKLAQLVTNARSEDPHTYPTGSIEDSAAQKAATVTGAARFAAGRVRTAVFAAAFAALATVAALVLTIVLEPEAEVVRGTLLLTPVGENEVARACPELSGAATPSADGTLLELDELQGRIYVSDLADEHALVRIRLAQHVCRDDGPTIVHLRRDDVVGVAGLSQP